MRAALRAEGRKLLAQPAPRVLVLVCGLGPLLFAAVLSGQSGVPGDTLLGGWVHNSPYAVSLVVLGFAGYLGFGMIAGALAGDMFAAEDRYGTWKSILTRSRGRHEVFLGKLLAAWSLALLLLVLAATSSIVGGLLFTDDGGLVGLGGQSLSSGEALLLVVAAWALSALPLFGFVCLGLLCSAASRSGIVGALGPVLAGLAMQLLALVGNGSWMHAALLSSSFDAWHGLFAAPAFYAPLAIGLAVALLWSAACTAACWRVLARREIAGAPLARRAGWGLPARAVAAVALVIGLLGLTGSLGPSAVTAARLQGAIGPAFERLTLLQQQELGRTLRAGAALNLRTSCRRRSGTRNGQGDDWVCTLTVVAPGTAAEPLLLTPVAYDVSVKSNGCYKADAPPSFVGQQTLHDAAGHSVVNPLFTIYGCFDWTAAAARSASGPAREAEQRSSTEPEPALKELEQLAREPKR